MLKNGYLMIVHVGYVKDVWVLGMCNNYFLLLLFLINIIIIRNRRP